MGTTGDREGVPLLGVVKTSKLCIGASQEQLGSVSVKGVVIMDFGGNFMWWVALRGVSFERVVCVVKTRRPNFLPILANAGTSSRCVVRVPGGRVVVADMLLGNVNDHRYTQVSDVYPTPTSPSRAFVEAKEDHW